MPLWPLCPCSNNVKPAEVMSSDFMGSWYLTFAPRQNFVARTCNGMVSKSRQNTQHDFKLTVENSGRKIATS